jgi:tetratricopeptide (TPR) repeat protein
MKATTLLEQAIATPGRRLLDMLPAVETLARVYALNSALDASIALVERALAEAEENKAATVETLRLRVLLANALIDNTNFSQAEEVLAEALLTAETLRDPLALARVYWSEARLHTHHRNPRLGARYARRAIEILERTEDDAYVAMAYHLLAYAEIEAGKPESALRQLARGRELFGDDLTDRDAAKFALEETRAFLALGKTKQAASSAGEVLNKLDALDPLERGRSYMLLGDVFASSGDNERAVELYELAIELLETSGRSYLIEAGRRLSDLLESMGKHAEAFAALKRAVASEAEPVPARKTRARRVTS